MRKTAPIWGGLLFVGGLGKLGKLGRLGNLVFFLLASVTTNQPRSAVAEVV